MPIAIDLEISVFLEGPFNNSQMNSNIVSLLPLNQPFNSDPWFYNGTESVPAIPGSDIVDWIFIELRNAQSASLADATTIFDQQAAFLRNDGMIVDLTGNPLLHFDSSVSDSLFVVIHQRNHLSIMTAFGVAENDGIYSYDFTTAASQAFGTASQKLIGTGIYGMYGGEGELDGIIDNKDKSPVWDGEAGSQGYLITDYNLDGESSNIDKNDLMVPNLGKAAQVPE